MGSGLACMWQESYKKGSVTNELGMTSCNPRGQYLFRMDIFGGCAVSGNDNVWRVVL